MAESAPNSIQFAGASPDAPAIPQYHAGQIFAVWAAAALPMAALGWIVAPALTGTTAGATHAGGFERLAVLTVGLVWQFVLVATLLYREAGTLRWSAWRTRLWLGPPRDPVDGGVRRRLWWWVVPLIVVTAAFELALSPWLDRAWVWLVPVVAEPSGFSLNGVLATPEARARLVGAWDVWGLFLVSALFNTVVGEELLFRGWLLPRMAGVCGRWDWLVNGVLFGLYHLHQPWGLPGNIVGGTVCYAWPSRRFRCAWFGIAAHSGQSVFFAILLLGLVLGRG